MKAFTFKVTKDIATTIQYLTVIEKFVSVHPLIYKMIELGENNYKVFEKIRLGIFVYRFTYKATISHNNNSVKINAYVMGFTKLTMQFHLQREGNATIINEQVAIQSVLPIKNYMTKLIQTQHQKMFENIDNKKSN